MCSGFTLIEATVSMVVVSIAAAGVMLLFQGAVRGSADTLAQKQAYAVAQSLLEEIEGMPFTYCDPRDANVKTASSPAGCAATAEGLGPELGETRYAPANPFNNVNDYNGFVMGPGVLDVSGAAVGGPAFANYTTTVTTVPLAFAGIPASESLLITVTVDAGNVHAVLQGIRTRYAPNTP